ncbi:MULTISPECIES: PTS sugar transporter subunit IIB [Lactobacillus]|jgi:PTS family lichenan porter component IIB|uniref:PTS sugar transporter subunit IIB n=1 Tax=Lactobacillus mulieris TaxID=2508708 RepID=A0AAP3GWI3_9LACO|nr:MULTISPECIES: PTS sugar transporter subunit IIB [Lactobacillus]EFH30179.1 PTS system, Lactose/Cellobiose specific IIB subunit [Lactobacillus jensenii JV-V16]KAA9244094.1 PTS sugar transporter subunit IIB [Lactobacillus jensenii]MCF1797201.1 PTS sugar transporter subunit IIB [Lactobacillus mulieris]MCW8094356.1 PTS sugar transporter subunit IIB [Lactobacillus mulieris]MCW8123688.1 PTS sugar transporter subunit IIB [Lactobacillus mulieris]
MAEKTIMLCCAAGMSTSMLVARMQDAAKADGEDVEIFACPAAEADDKLAQENVSAILLGPQVRYMLDSFKQKVSDKNIPVDVIDMQAYGMMDGEKVLKQGLSLIK